jgi:septal ring factor EnvC (AmiA/AmiB activator)
MAEKTKEQLERENQILQDKLSKTSAKLKAVEATRPKNAKPIVELDGKHYEVIGGERTQKKVLTRDELAKDTQRCRQLLAKGSDLLREIASK